MSRTILMTGASGFVGTWLRRALASQAPEMSVVALTAPGDAGAGHVATDLLDAAAIDAAVEQVRPDIVIHLAAQASVARTILERGATFAINLGGSLNLAIAIARHAPRATLLFASSSEVYGESFRGGPVNETSPTVPLNDYAKSKRLAEDMFAAVLPAEAQLIVARPFNHTGPGQREDFVLPSFAGQVARIEAGSQPPRMMVGNIDVHRDFLDVRDVVAAYLALIGAASMLPARFTCNISTGKARRLRDYVETLRALSAMDFDIVVDPARMRSSDVPIAEGDASLLHRSTGWTPRIGADQMLRDLLIASRAKLSL